MPQQRPAIDDLLRTQGPREEMIQGPSGLDYDAHGLSLRIVTPPLFRRSENGGLLQALRVVVQAGADAGDVTFSVADGATILDRITVGISAGRTLVHLFFPEVRETRTFRFEVSGGERKPLETPVEVRPQRKWSVFVVHHSHLDIGYTDPQGLIVHHHLQYLDSVLDLASATDGWADDAQFRWNVEATWPLLRWMATRPARDRDELIERVRQGRVEICALPFSMHTEAYSIDELSRQLRYADELRGRHDLSITTAMQTDVPGATMGLLGCLVDADLRYLSVAHNYAGRSVPHLVGGQELTRPFYWRARNGKRLLVWYTDTPHGSAYMEGNFVGLAADYETALEVLPGYLSALGQRPYPYQEHLYGWMGIPPDVATSKQPYPHDILHLRVQGVIADNASPSIVPAEIVREWNENWAYPRLRLATNREFFEAAEERLEDRLETYSGDWTDWWVDGIGSAARHLGLNRRAQASIRTAQTLHTLAGVLAADGVEPAEEIGAAYENMALFDEHTWGAANPWDDDLEKMGSGALQWGKKASFAQEAYDGAAALVRSGTHRLSRIFRPSGSSLASVTVFNPCSWTRTDVVRVFVPASRIDYQRSFAVVDAAAEARVPHVVEGQEHPAFRPRGSYVSFVAHDVPPYGYARYELVEDSEPTGASTVGNDPVIENEYYRVRVDPMKGSVSQLLDKDSGGDLARADAELGFNQYVYDRYTSAAHFNHLSGRIQATDLSLLGKRSLGRLGVVTDHSSNPVWDRMTVRLNGDGADYIETTLTLLRGVKRLDIKNRIGKLGTPEKESVYFAFPFNVEDPSVSYEITGGIDSPDAPHIPGSANHMRAIRHWVSLEGANRRLAWATLEAPLVQFGNIHLPYAPFPETIEPSEAHPGAIYSWALNNIWDTNFPPQQQGQIDFRYSVASGDGVEAKELGLRTAAALTAPLVGILSAPGTRGELPDRGSFCHVDRPDVEIVALSPSRRGHDLVVLLQSFAATTLDVRVSFPQLQVARAWIASHLERHLEEVEVGGEVRFAIQAGSYVSLAVDLAGGRQENP
jgi:hypothetical protein